MSADEPAAPRSQTSGAQREQGRSRALVVLSVAGWVAFLGFVGWRSYSARTSSPSEHDASGVLDAGSEYVETDAGAEPGVAAQRTAPRRVMLAIPAKVTRATGVSLPLDAACVFLLDVLEAQPVRVTTLKVICPREDESMLDGVLYSETNEDGGRHSGVGGVAFEMRDDRGLGRFGVAWHDLRDAKNPDADRQLPLTARRRPEVPIVPRVDLETAFPVAKLWLEPLTDGKRTIARALEFEIRSTTFPHAGDPFDEMWSENGERACKRRMHFIVQSADEPDALVGRTPFRIGEECSLEVSPEFHAVHDGRAVLRCGSRLIYGGPPRSGYGACRAGGTFDDETPSSLDGDPRIRIAVAREIGEWRADVLIDDDRASAWRAHLVGEARSCALDGSFKGLGFTPDGTPYATEIAFSHQRGTARVSHALAGGEANPTSYEAPFVVDCAEQSVSIRGVTGSGAASTPEGVAGRELIGDIEGSVLGLVDRKTGDTYVLFRAPVSS